MRHEDNHAVRATDHLTRRRLLTAAGMGLGAALLPSSLLADPVSAAATKPVSLPGFAAFAKTITTYRKGSWYLVEIQGALPDHLMMVGITNWQQQVPIPQDYTGAMAWRMPAKPTLAAAPISTATALRRQAIAIAANGVPIFNALNNRGEDSQQIGELDDWGGHCGRGDDYHYHVAPLHLQKVVGDRSPIAYALDGYPIYGTTEPDGRPMRSLNTATNGHTWRGSFHYHGTTTYPYTCGAIVGKVTVVDDMITPQPIPPPVRQPAEPLPGASITLFERSGTDRFRLEYLLEAQTFQIDYRANAKLLEMTFTAPDGATRHEIYVRD